jgi:CBS domain-containing protein
MSKRDPTLRVRELMTPEVVALSPELALRDAVAILDQRHIGGAPVVANGQLVGVFSASDLLAFEVESPGVPQDRPEITDLAELEQPEEWEAGNEPPATFFTDWWADTGAETVERFMESRQPEWSTLAEHTVGDVMSHGICSVSPDAGVAEAARYMLRAGVHRLLVTDAGRPVGILTTMDLVRAIAEGRLAAR